MQFDIRTILDNNEKTLLEGNNMTNNDFSKLLGVKNSYVTAPKKNNNLHIQNFEKLSNRLGFQSKGLLK